MALRTLRPDAVVVAVLWLSILIAAARLPAGASTPRVAVDGAIAVAQQRDKRSWGPVGDRLPAVALHQFPSVGVTCGGGFTVCATLPVGNNWRTCPTRTTFSCS